MLFQALRGGGGRVEGLLVHFVKEVSRLLWCLVGLFSSPSSEGRGGGGGAHLWLPSSSCAGVGWEDRGPFPGPEGLKSSLAYVPGRQCIFHVVIHRNRVGVGILCFGLRGSGRFLFDQVALLLKEAARC